MKISDFKIHQHERLDDILLSLVEMVGRAQQLDSQYFGMVASCIIDKQNRIVCGINRMAPDGRRMHAERVAIDRYRELYGEPESGCICVTTLSPCCRDLDERYGESCNDLISSTDIHKVYCGYRDPTEDRWSRKTYTLHETKNRAVRASCKGLADTFLETNKSHEST